jgi:protein-S-isoprenylcysteine O-methyltransferase Ste14
MGPAFRTLVFTVIAPGTVTVLLPYLVLTQTETGVIGPTRYAGLPVLCIGIVIYAWCARDFAIKGRGTPAPIEPPKTLVIEGLYRYVRNPMYVGVLSVLFGEVIWFASPTLLIYTCVIGTAFHAFIRLYEEPTLLDLFGDQYTAYCEEVPRWWPRRSH